MTLVAKGSLTLGQCVPLALSASAEMAASVNQVLPEVSAKIAGLQALQASLVATPPSLSASLTAAENLVSALNVAISLGMPGVDFQLTAIAAQLAELNVTLGALNARLSLALQYQATLGSPGVFAYQYTGPVGSLGAEVQAELGGGIGGGPPSLPVGAWLFIATDGGAINAARTVFMT